MGSEKLFLSVDCVPLIERVIRNLRPPAGEILVSVASRQVASACSLLSGIIPSGTIRLVEDRAEGRGPLEGIAAGLSFSKFEWSFICACDMPFLSRDVLMKLWNCGDQTAAIILPRIGGFFEPLHAFYSRRALRTVLDMIDRGERKITALFDEVPVSIVEEEAFTGIAGYRRSFANINRKKDLALIGSPD